MNCNAIYEVTFTSSELVNALLDLQSIRLTAKSKASNEIFLTDCVDFDVFYESDLSDSNPLYTDGVDNKLYYPSYIDKATPLSESEEVYYKLSYLSNLISEDPLQSHSNFYSSNPKPDDIDLAIDDSVTFTSETVTIYINVNYAPTELEQYYKISILVTSLRCTISISHSHSLRGQVLSYEKEDFASYRSRCFCPWY